MTIIDMKTLDETQRTQAAQMLTCELPQGWATLEEALKEVNTRLAPEENTYIAAMEDDEVIGWCGLLPHYDGKVFELHPLVVRRDRQRGGVGRALIRRVEEIARAKGGRTLWLGADDSRPGGETSFAGVDLYDDLPCRFREFDPGTHQAAFYRKVGFTLVGVLPDADGPGVPDIFMAKKL